MVDIEPLAFFSLTVSMALVARSPPTESFETSRMSFSMSLFLIHGLTESWTKTQSLGCAVSFKEFNAFRTELNLSCPPSAIAKIFEWLKKDEELKLKYLEKQKIREEEQKVKDEEKRIKDLEIKRQNEEEQKLKDFRNNFKGVRAKSIKTNFIIYGSIDDIWLNKDTGEVVILDYKATSTKEKINYVTSLKSYHKSYLRQLDFYAYLLKLNKFLLSVINEITGNW